MLEALYKQIYFLLMQEPVYSEFLLNVIKELEALNKIYLDVLNEETNLTSIAKYDDIDSAVTETLVTKAKSNDLFKLLFHNFSESFDFEHEEVDEDWGNLTDHVKIEVDYGTIYTERTNTYYSLDRDMYEDWGTLDITESPEEIDLQSMDSVIEDYQEESEHIVFQRPNLELSEITEVIDFATYESISGSLNTEPESYKECLRRALRTTTNLQDIKGTASAITHLLYVNGVGCIVQDLFCPIGNNSNETARNYKNQSCWIASPDKEDKGVIGRALLETKNSNILYVSNPDDFEVDDYVFCLTSGFSKDSIRKIIYKDGVKLYLDDLTSIKANSKINVLRPKKWVTNPDETRYYKVPYIDVTVLPTTLYNTKELLPTIKTLVLSSLPVNVCLRDIQLGGMDNYEYFNVSDDHPIIEVETQQKILIDDNLQTDIEIRQSLRLNDKVSFEEYEPTFIVIDSGFMGTPITSDYQDVVIDMNNKVYRLYSDEKLIRVG